MNIFKTGYFPPDLPKMFTAIKNKALSTAQYFANLIKHYSLMVYTCVVDRINPSRVKVVTSLPKVDVKQPALKTAVSPRPRTIPSAVVIPTIAETTLNDPQPVARQSSLPVATLEIENTVLPEPAKEVMPIPVFLDKATQTFVKEVPPEVKAVTIQDMPTVALATIRKSASEVNFDASVQKMIRLANSYFPENQELDHQQALDPFQTCVHLRD